MPTPGLFSGLSASRSLHETDQARRQSLASRNSPQTQARAGTFSREESARESPTASAPPVAILVEVSTRQCPHFDAWPSTRHPSFETQAFRALLRELAQAYRYLDFSSTGL